MQDKTVLRYIIILYEFSEHKTRRVHTNFPNFFLYFSFSSFLYIYSPWWYNNIFTCIFYRYSHSVIGFRMRNFRLKNTRTYANCSYMHICIHIYYFNDPFWIYHERTRVLTCIISYYHLYILYSVIHYVCTPHFFHLMISFDS